MANINFKASAISATTLSPIMEGRDKLTMEQVRDKYKDGVTVTEFDFITVKEKTFPVLAIKEDAKVCFFGGHVLTKICNDWAAAYDGDVTAASEDLKAEGGVKMKFGKGQTHGGNSITTVQII